MSESEMPAKFKPGASQMSGAKPSVVMYHIAIANMNSVVHGPWMHLQEMLNTNPETCQGGLYEHSSGLFMIVKTEPNGARMILYTWNSTEKTWEFVQR